MKIKNFDSLSVSPMRHKALLIAEAGLESIDTTEAIITNVKVRGDNLNIVGRKYSLNQIGRVFVVGVGKCALEAGVALEKILGDHLHGGIIIDVKNGGYLKKLKYFKGTHPLTSEDNVKATREIVNLLNKLNEDDFLIFVISGGGSALLSYPEDFSYKEEVEVFKSLTKAGATIQELNTVRKHMSLARGGFLAKYAYPVQSVGLIFSDVTGDDMGFIASGPTVKDDTTIDAAAAILAKYDIFDTCNIENCGLIETPKENKFFEKINNVVVVSNAIALKAMEKKAKELGLESEIYHDMKGEAGEVGLKIVADLQKSSSKKVLLYGGETTVIIKGNGRGGRNLHLAAAALQKIKSKEIIISLASDGRDNGDFAGAICDIITKDAVKKKDLNISQFLKNNDTYPLFEKVGNYIFTGDTGSNVSDLVIAIKV